jgi:sigma-B regulation protein RsbU (phosphoserine phosphatase)
LTPISRSKANLECAHDSEDAIARLEATPFDLVLLDVMMPKVDGYQVLTWIKDQARLRDLPVIMISALNDTSSVVRCIELGAVDYRLKPFNPVMLKARLGATLEKKRLRDEDGHGAACVSDTSKEFSVDLWASMEPTREVGGDLYDFFRTEDGRLCFLVGDDSNKGMPAALFMRSPDGASASPADIVTRVDRELCQDNSDMMFVTLFFVMFTPESGEVEFCDAGHNCSLPAKREWESWWRALWASF